MKPKALVILFLPSCLYAQEYTKLVWSDEFNYAGLPDDRKWSYEEGYVRNGEKQLYVVKNSENSRVENGMLVIEAKKTTPKKLGFLQELFATKPQLYTSASLTTRNLNSWVYGRVEVRAKVPQGKGVWPAIWLLGLDKEHKGWPAKGEIDIMEYVGYQQNKVHVALHTKMRNHQNKKAVNRQFELNDLDKSFYTYAVEKHPNKIDFFVDNELLLSYKKEGNSEAYWPFNNPMYLIINLAIGGSWGGKYGVDDAIFPQKFLIDYVRVYQ